MSFDNIPEELRALNPMRFAYADPPYLGQGQKHYKQHHADASAWDSLETHHELIKTLSDEFPDGWALSLSSTSLPMILPLCPPGVRICAWVKPFSIFKPNVGLSYSWEPVILSGGRKIPRSQPTVRDWIAENITLKKGLTGAKPARFCSWIISMLNFQEGDELVDLFPGTGSMNVALQNATCPPEIGGIARKVEQRIDRG